TTARGMMPLQFVWRRIRRILPLYWIACIPALLIACSAGLAWRGALATVLLWPATDVMTEPYLPVAWTLTFEMLFYFAAALVLVDRIWLYVLLALHALAFLLRANWPVFQFLGNPLVIEFLFGVVVARLPMCRIAVLGIPIGIIALIAAGIHG